MNPLLPGLGHRPRTAPAPGGPTRPRLRADPHHHAQWDVLALGSRITDVDGLAYLAAFGGGLVSFLSPCVLPMVPAYLSMVTGLDVADLAAGRREHARRIAATTALFVAGFGVVFVALGLTASAFGRTLREHQVLLTRVSGAVMVGLAIFMIGSLTVRAPWLYQERRFHPRPGRLGAAAPFVIGAAFGFGWSPCIGPVLGSILGIAATRDRIWSGGTLLAVYALGLGVPFLVSGLALGRVTGGLAWFRRHSPVVVGVSAAIIGGFGLVLLTDSLSRVTVTLQQWLVDLRLDWIVRLG
ncbi:MAG: cytochrome c biogenesis CcdA family protein [Actinomycetota bacterium]